MSTAPANRRVTVQFSLVPAADAFVPIILGAVRDIGAIEGLAVQTDAVSSTLSGPHEAVLAALTEVFVKASASGAHIVQPVLASYGSSEMEGEGKPVIDLSGFSAPAPTGVATSAQFVLLPSNGGVRAAIETQSLAFLDGLGLATRVKPLVTRVDGDAGLVLAGLFWLLVRSGQAVGEVVLQTTLVSNSPTAEAFA